MKKSKRILIVLIITVIAIAFIPRFYREATAPNHIKNFNKEQALEDYDYLWDTLEENYPLLGLAEREYNINRIQIKSKYRSQISNISNIDLNKFYSILERLLFEYKYMGHLNIVNPKLFVSMNLQTKSMTKREIANYGITNYIDPSVVYTYEYFLGRKLPQNLEESKRANDDNLIFKEIDQNNKLVIINSFRNEFIDEDNIILHDFFENTPDSSNIIIDLTKNGGGSDLYWMDNIVAPNIGMTLIGEDREVLTKDIDLISNYKNYVDNFTNDLTKYREVINSEDLSELKYSFTIRSPYNISPSNDQPLFNGKIYVLISLNSQSATDGFIKFCKDTGFATLVGTRSGGNGPALNIIEDKLPNSNLLFRYQVDYTLNSDYSPNALYGEEADIISLPDEKPIDTFKRIVLNGN
ncbi:MAG: hypothetical protein GXZ08_04495 [Tissierellia bacterium]|nr:hypothetical protein [Tissierellia bacterium]